MCFSATASLIAGGALSTTGVLTLKKAKTKAEIPFAIIPLLFGIQQLIEGFVWLSFSWQAIILNFVMTYLFSLFAFVVWPIYVPFAVGRLETVSWRKKVIYVCQVAGLTVGLYLLYSHTISLVTSEIVSRHVVYNNSHFYQLWVMAFYFTATIVSCFFSSKKIVNLFGILAFLFAMIAYWFYANAFVSVWCFFAAVLSVLVYWYFKRKPITTKDVKKDLSTA